MDITLRLQSLTNTQDCMFLFSFYSHINTENKAEVLTLELNYKCEVVKFWL